MDTEVDCNVEPFRVANRNAENHSRRQPPLGRGDRVGDRCRYEPIPTEGDLISWAGTLPQERRKRWKTPLHTYEKGCPLAQDHSGPMRMGGHQHQGNLLDAQYLRIRSRRGAKKAIGAVAASILTAAYHMLKNGTLYQDLGANHFDKRAQGKPVLRLVKRLKNLGFAVQMTPMAA